MYYHSNNTIYSQILIIAQTWKTLDLLLKQSLPGIVVFYKQKTPKRGEHSWDQGIVSCEAVFSWKFGEIEKRKKKNTWRKIEEINKNYNQINVALYVIISNGNERFFYCIINQKELKLYGLHFSVASTLCWVVWL